MECKKDEAIRAQRIAEKKFKDKDVGAARKIALKAQNLYPKLDGISQMLSTFDVHIAAENIVSGEMDWYGVLGITPTADDDTIRKQYRKLALLLHPDKNKSVGADGAFKFISEAWSLLSDKAKRLAYNQRRNSTGLQQRVQTQPQRPYPDSSSNGVGSSTNSIPLKPTTQRNVVPTPPSQPTTQRNIVPTPPSRPTTQRNTVPIPPFPRTDTFWTICSHCKMQYEHLKVYLNRFLHCPSCHSVFMAVEVVPPEFYSSFQQSNQNLRTHTPSSNTGRNTVVTGNIRQERSTGPNLFKYTNSHRGAYPTMAGTVKAKPFVAAQATNVYQQAKSRLKREHQESQSSTLKGEASSKRRVLNGDDLHYGSTRKLTPLENRKMLIEKALMEIRKNLTGWKSEALNMAAAKKVEERKEEEMKSLTPLENRKMLIEKALTEIRKNLNGWKSEALNMAAAKKVEERKEEEIKSATTCCVQSNGIGKSFMTKRDDKSAKNLGGNYAKDGKSEVCLLLMNVPDPDFHDFDQDRTEMSFEDNQIWAAYDDDDGMPRFYAFVQKVISNNPFKLRITRLASKTNREFGSMKWVSSGFAKSCGEFRIGKYEVSKSLNSYSHKVKWTKGARGVIQIVPQKGDIWALYRNWSSEWNEHTPDEVIHKYDMVEVLDDYTVEKGVTVTPLVKVAGFSTVFRPHNSNIMIIPKEEMLRFSHQVPNYVLTGQEGENAPKGCQELDPAATPLELLQVSGGVEVPTGENHGHTNKDMSVI